MSKHIPWKPYEIVIEEFEQMLFEENFEGLKVRQMISVLSLLNEYLEVLCECDN